MVLRRLGPAFVAALLAAAIVLLVPPVADAKPAKIKGRFSAPGYSVIALAADGEAKVARARHRKFKLRPPARRVTLHLRAPDATYGGPVVVGLAGGRAIVGVRAGAKLGMVEVDRDSGYASVASRLPGRYVNGDITATAANGVPIGAGNYGRVAVDQAAGRPADLDLDGIPASLDVDDDGDLVLDPFDDPPAANGSEVVVGGRSLLNLDLPDIVNANAPGMTDARIEAALPSFGGVILGALGIDASGPDDPGVELDCGDPDTGLIYCRRNGGTGTLTNIGLGLPFGGSEGDRYPACCDADEDGFGSLAFSPVPQVQFNGHHVALLHGASADQIRAGDVLVARVADGADFAGTMSYVFETPPALVSYTDELGNTTAMDYPVTPGAPGTRENPFVVTDGPDADPTPPGAPHAFPEIEVTMTFWRPQRSSLPGEAGRWMDVGNTVYVASRRGTMQDPSSYGGGGCRASAYSEGDPNLTPVQAPDFPLWFEPVSGLEDTSDDQSADPANTFTFTLNLSRCFGLDFAQEPHTFGVLLRAQPANPRPGPPDNTRATVAWFRSG
jgi:hypothetical protein